MLKLGKDDELHLAKHLDLYNKLQLGITFGHQYDAEMFIDKHTAVMLVAHLQHVFKLKDQT